jgi:predicted lipoprotein with Yx(FWY)xxD motif
MKLALTLFASLALTAGVALAQSLPAEVKLVDGAFTDQAGKPLYTYTNDTMRNMSHCENRCAEAWPPLVAKPGSEPVGDFYLIKRGGGVQQWAYKNQPLYTSAKDKAGKAATAANELWLVAKP